VRLLLLIYYIILLSLSLCSISLPFKQYVLRTTPTLSDLANGHIGHSHPLWFGDTIFTSLCHTEKLFIRICSTFIVCCTSLTDTWFFVRCYSNNPVIFRHFIYFFYQNLKFIQSLHPILLLFILWTWILLILLNTYFYQLKPGKESFG